MAALRDSEIGEIAQRVLGELETQSSGPLVAGTSVPERSAEPTTGIFSDVDQDVETAGVDNNSLLYIYLTIGLAAVNKLREVAIARAEL